MKKDKSIFNYIFSKVVVIQLSGLLILFVVVFIFLLVSIRRLDDITEQNIAESILNALDTVYSSIEHFETGFQRKLEAALKESKDLEDMVNFLEAYKNLPFEKLNYKIISEDDIETPAIKAKIANLNINEYFVERYFTPDSIKKNIYIKGKDGILLITSTRSMKDLSLIPKFLEFKKKIKLLDGINIFNREFEPLISETERISLEDRKILQKVFETGKPYSVRAGNKFKIYTSWRIDKTNEFFRPIGVVLTLNVRPIHNMLTFVIGFFLVTISIVLLISTLKTIKLSKQISEPFERIIKSMKEFRESNFEKQQISMENCNIREVNEIINEYRTLAEKINTSFQEIRDLNKELEESYREIEHINNELEKTYLEFSQRLSIIAEGYDETTGNHIERVGKLSAFIAEKLGLSTNFQKSIEYYAPLHDIGKIMIPKEILSKNGKLTSEEFELMKKHTIYGGAILSNSERLKMARDIALYHHEKWDGSGYPYGLKGDEIPVEAAIVGLIDVYDALRSERPYKKALSHKEALEIISNGDDRTRPEHFNPKVLKIFLKYESEIREIWENLSKNSRNLLKESLKILDRRTLV